MNVSEHDPDGLPRGPAKHQEFGLFQRTTGLDDVPSELISMVPGLSIAAKTAFGTPLPPMVVPHREIDRTAMLTEGAADAVRQKAEGAYDTEPVRCAILRYAGSFIPSYRKASVDLNDLAARLRRQYGCAVTDKKEVPLPGPRWTLATLPYWTLLLFGWSLAVAGLVAEFVIGLLAIGLVEEDLFTNAGVQQLLCLCAPSILAMLSTFVVFTIVPGPLGKRRTIRFFLAQTAIASVTSLCLFAWWLGHGAMPTLDGGPSTTFVLASLSFASAGASCGGKLLISHARASLFSYELRETPDTQYFGRRLRDAEWASAECLARAVFLERLVAEVKVGRDAFVKQCLTALRERQAEFEARMAAAMWRKIRGTSSPSTKTAPAPSPNGRLIESNNHRTGE